MNLKSFSLQNMKSLLLTSLISMTLLSSPQKSHALVIASGATSLIIIGGVLVGSDPAILNQEWSDVNPLTFTIGVILSEEDQPAVVPSNAVELQSQYQLLPAVADEVVRIDHGLQTAGKRVNVDIPMELRQSGVAKEKRRDAQNRLIDRLQREIVRLTGITPSEQAARALIEIAGLPVITN